MDKIYKFIKCCALGRSVRLRAVQVCVVAGGFEGGVGGGGCYRDPMGRAAGERYVGNAPPPSPSPQMAGRGKRKERGAPGPWIEIHGFRNALLRSFVGGVAGVIAAEPTVRPYDLIRTVSVLRPQRTKRPYNVVGLRTLSGAAQWYSPTCGRSPECISTLTLTRTLRMSVPASN